MRPSTSLIPACSSENRYFDVEVSYAKASPDEIHIRIIASNRGPDTAELHLLPTLWFRNTWSWGDGSPKPSIRAIEQAGDAAWAVSAGHPESLTYWLYGRQSGQRLFTENETNAHELWGVSNDAPYVKDAFHRHVIEGSEGAIEPRAYGHQICVLASFRRARLEQKSGSTSSSPRSRSKRPSNVPKPCLRRAPRKRTRSMTILLPAGGPEDRRIFRQALAGMIWSKQFFNYDIERWLKGDKLPPPGTRNQGRNAAWKHLKAADVISMPDTWEYPWFAAWDLAFHCGALALIDVDFAKDQIELMLSERYLNPNGQIPAYEWNFSDVNPPVHALAALKAFRAERVQRGRGDLGFLQRVFHKLLLNYAWWINRKDADGAQYFRGRLSGARQYFGVRPLPNRFLPVIG